MSAEHAASQAIAARHAIEQHDLVMQRRTRKCSECGRVFDLFDETDNAEWSYGHDCE